MKHQLLLIIHLVAACIWVGGHMLLCLRYLPKALKEQDPGIIRDFEKQFEPLGIPALIISIITGIMMAYDYNVTVSQWFSFSGSIEKIISIKLSLLFLTLLLAAHARIFIIPKLNLKSLPFMAFHIILITLVGAGMLVFGSLVRIGGI